MHVFLHLMLKHSFSIFIKHFLLPLMLILAKLVRLNLLHTVLMWVVPNILVLLLLVRHTTILVVLLLHLLLL